jgi:DNA-binding transcriptional LysR family regulator
MDLRQVEYVLAVVDHGGFTRAAAALHVAQPSLSQGVRRLEAELGVTLFERAGRRVVLTGAGEAFVGPARRVLREVTMLEEAVAAVAGMTAGTLDLVSLPTLAADPLAPLVGRFRVAHPGVAVRVADPEDASAVADMVADGRCEVGLADLPARRRELQTVRLHRQELLAVCPPGTDVRDRFPVARFRDTPIVTSPPGTSTRELLEDALHARDVEPIVAVETSQREAIVPLVLAGAGVALLPAPLAHVAAAQGAVVAPLSPDVTRTIGLLHRPGPLSPAARAFVDLATGPPEPFSAA